MSKRKYLRLLLFSLIRQEHVGVSIMLEKNQNRFVKQGVYDNWKPKNAFKEVRKLTLSRKNNADIDTANMNKLQKMEEVLVDQML